MAFRLEVMLCVGAKLGLSITLKEERRLRVFENGVLSKVFIFGTKRGEVRQE
jgi:hypothetical protein